jgi:hypothetical protein
VDTLQSADILLTIARLLHDSTTISRKSMNTPVSNGSTFDKTHALELGEVGQLRDALVGELLQQARSMYRMRVQLLAKAMMDASVIRAQ